MPPVTPQKAFRHELHGHSRDDPYAWLKAANWQEALEDPSTLPAEIREYLQAENAYQEKVLASTAELQKQLYAEMRGRIKEDDSSVPVKDGRYAYQSRFREGGQYPILLRFPVDPTSGERIGEDEILLDGDSDAQGHDYYDLGSFGHSPDHRFVDIARDYHGAEYFDIQVLDTHTGKIIGMTIEHTAANLEWSANSRSLFYVWRDEEGRPKKIFRLEILENGKDDAGLDRFELSKATLIYEETDPGFFLDLHKSKSGDWILISAHDHTTSEIQLINAKKPDRPPLLVAAREAGHEYELSHAGEDWYIRTNCNGAVDFKLMRVPVTKPERKNWEPFIEHQPGSLILALSGFEQFLVRHVRENALPALVIRDLQNDKEHRIAFDEDAYDLSQGLTLEWSSAVMRFTYESPAQPNHVFDYHMGSRERKLLKLREIPSGHDPAKYETRRLMIANEEDGEMIPVTLLRLANQNGPAPLLLYGYGSYGITIPADFNSHIFSLIDRGIQFAIAHIRGSKAKGYQWYLEGKKKKKRNSFVDFLSVAKGLVAQGFTRKGEIAIQGGSAGGLLVGAALNMADEGLLAGAVSQVPFVDVLSTMCDAHLPLTPPEWPEWGNPIQSRGDYQTLLSYSPYDQVHKKAYPPVLITAGISDPRVTYWEPAKWAARLREYSTSDEPVLLRTNMTTGHRGASGRWESLKERALSYAFIVTLFANK